MNDKRAALGLPRYNMIKTILFELTRYVVEQYWEELVLDRPLTFGFMELICSHIGVIHIVRFILLLISILHRAGSRNADLDDKVAHSIFVEVNAFDYHFSGPCEPKTKSHLELGVYLCNSCAHSSGELLKSELFQDFVTASFHSVCKVYANIILTFILNFRVRDYLTSSGILCTECSRVLSTQTMFGC